MIGYPGLAKVWLYKSTTGTFGTGTAGKLIPITASQGIWQLPPGQFPKS